VCTVIERLSRVQRGYPSSTCGRSGPPGATVLARVAAEFPSEHGDASSEERAGNLQSFVTSQSHALLD